ncbi:DNA recombination protein RmuC [Marinoscillum furvescens]|uniref:DNA recombination protein RmuC n=1 Tax=Marinoscillum furvescens DSM 4134 TaxID=1122208 RepID=A0A3D9L6E9_MARFU|nr:DNA recombination protein RmuC [Marinoscillum furvescens]REE01737.1 DNA recombination protein RmuC [Marinoscillum furvescens DSM 4134]
MEFESIIVLLVGLLAGGAIGYLVAKTKTKPVEDPSADLRVELQMEQERHTRLSQDFAQVNQELKAEREKVMALSSDNSSLQANYKNLQERLGEQKEELEQLQKRFAAEFKNLANEIFEEKSKKFTDQNKSNLDDLLKPLGEKLMNFEKRVEQNSKESLQWNTSLKTELSHLKELNQKITKEAENLTKALKGDTKVQGNWGEVILERILEKSGLEKDREYFLQESFTSEEGRRLRPDVIIKLPDNKNLVIDAKASLVAYEKYVNADSETERDQYLKEHLLSLRAHIKGLSEKNYHKLFDTGTLDYVLMFVPIESAFALMVQQGGELYNEAHDKNIIIVSPATLIATLRTVSSIWKHEYQNRNALEIARQGGALYDKFKSFVDDLTEVGKSLEKSKAQYGEAMKKLVDGKGNLISRTERLKELGAKTSKSMNEKILERAGATPEQQESEPPATNELFG